MRTYQLPGGAGTVVLTGDEDNNRAQIRILEARHAFTVAYCEARGWPTDATLLSFEQIFEITDQPGWKDAGRE